MVNCVCCCLLLSPRFLLKVDGPFFQRKGLDMDGEWHKAMHWRASRRLLITAPAPARSRMATCRRVSASFPLLRLHS